MARSQGRAAIALFPRLSNFIHHRQLRYCLSLQVTQSFTPNTSTVHSQWQDRQRHSRKAWRFKTPPSTFQTTLGKLYYCTAKYGPGPGLVTFPSCFLAAKAPPTTRQTTRRPRELELFSNDLALVRQPNWLQATIVARLDLAKKKSALLGNLKWELETSNAFV